MFEDFVHNLRQLRYTRPFAGLWQNLRYLWYTRENGVLLFFSIFTGVFSILGVVIYYSFTDHGRHRDITCLALNVYHEARGEPMAGQYAVAEVTMNRVASKRYPNTICKVVYQKNWDRLRRRYVGAFSWTELNKTAMPRGKAWERAWLAAETVYYRRKTPRLKGVLFYHAHYIRPSWARQKKPVARIGKHIFYK